MRLRTDRRAAATVAVVLGVAVGGVAAWFTAAIGSAWGGGDIVGALPVATIVFGAPAAAIVIGASVLGYAVMSRWRGVKPRPASSGPSFGLLFTPASRRRP